MYDGGGDRGEEGGGRGLSAQLPGLRTDPNAAKDHDEDENLIIFLGVRKEFFWDWNREIVSSFQKQQD